LEAAAHESVAAGPVAEESVAFAVLPREVVDVAFLYVLMELLRRVEYLVAYCGLLPLPVWHVGPPADETVSLDQALL